MAMRLFLILLAAAVLFSLVAYYLRNNSKQERFSTNAGTAPSAPALAPLTPPPSATGDWGTQVAMQQQQQQTQLQMQLQQPSVPVAMEPTSMEMYRAVGQDDGSRAMADPFPGDRVTPDDLLPKDAANSMWAQMNPAGQGDVKDQNFLTAGYMVGYNTQGSSLRNASHDIRSSPPNPRHCIGPWNQSTIEPDLNRRPLE